MYAQVKQWFENDPRKLFLLDGLGALLSAFLLGIVLVRLQHVFGIPSSTLYFLAFLPCLFLIYDIYCYLKISSNLDVFLKILAILNLSYCALSVGLAVYHFQRVTFLGWTYIILEVMIVLVVAYFELKTAKKLKLEKLQCDQAENREA